MGRGVYRHEVLTTVAKESTPADTTARKATLQLGCACRVGRKTVGIPHGRLNRPAVAEIWRGSRVEVRGFEVRVRNSQPRTSSLEPPQELLELSVLNPVPVLPPRIRPFPHLTRERTHRSYHLRKHLRIPLHKPRRPPIGEPNDIVKDEHLPVGCVARADTDHGHA